MCKSIPTLNGGLRSNTIKYEELEFVKVVRNSDGYELGLEV